MSERTTSTTRQLISGICFLIGLLGTGAVLRWLSPDYMNEVFGWRAQTVREAEAPFDVVFFGSSRVSRAVDPEIIDAELSVRSYNASVPGAYTFQVEHLLEESLKGPQIPRFVVLELDAFDPQIREENRTSRRMIAVHEPTIVTRSIRAIVHQEGLSSRAFDQSVPRLELGLLHWFRVGGAEEIWKAWNGEARFIPPSGDVVAARGFESYDMIERRVTQDVWGPEFQNRIQAFADFTDWEDKVSAKTWTEIESRLREARMWPGIGAPLLREKQARILARGSIPVFVVMPRDHALPVVLEEAGAAGLKHVINLNDAVRYPELFTRKSRFDGWHMSTEGAVVLSRILARELRPILAR